MKKTAWVVLGCSVLVAHAMDFQAMEKKAQVCAACHGTNGVSDHPEWPSLAGQHASYLLKQLNDYKQGKTRINPIMAAQVAPLSTQDMEEFALFYSKLPFPERSTPEQYVKRGQQLYRGGDFEQHITACIACHGPQGTGNGQAGFPVVSGQQPEYTVQQLQAFKDGKRSNDLNSIMRDISRRMSTEDMTAVAFYMAGLH